MRASLKVASVQAAALLALFAVFELTVPDAVFKEAGEVIGPASWVGCSVVSALWLRIPLRAAVLATLLGAVALSLVAGVLGHLAGILCGALCFGVLARPPLLGRSQARG